MFNTKEFMVSSIWQTFLLFCFFTMQCHSDEGGNLRLNIDYREMQSLLELREHLKIEDYDVWPRGSNPCNQWYGVVCNKGHVVSLTLPPQIDVRQHVEAKSLSTNESFLLDLVVSNLVKLPFLRSFNASGFMFQGSIPTTFTNLKRLEVLDLASTSISGTLPLTFGTLTRLKFLSLSQNNLSGNVSTSLGALCNLEHLNLSFNLFTGGLPYSLFSCASRLLSVDLSYNGFEGTLPMSIGCLSSLQYLALSHNFLQGNLPLQHQNWTHLEYLDISNNFLSGSLPNSISYLESLSNLNLGHNCLTGPIPSTISECSRLEVLLLDNNMLNHGIPISLSMLKNLVILSLSFNNLTGTLPPGILALPNLTSIGLSHNLLYGWLYSSQGYLSKFQSFDVSYNFLHGDIPPRFYLLDGITKNCFPKARKQHSFKSCWLFYSKHKLPWHDLLPESIVPNNINVSSRDVHEKKIHRKEKLIVFLGCITGGSCILAIAGAYMIFLQKFKHNLEVELQPQTIETEADKYSSVVLWPSNSTVLGEAFSFDTLLKATNGFDSSCVIAYGQSGSFYKGVLDRGTEIVVKRIYTTKMMELYLNEVEMLRKASHARLISLLGHCTETSNCEKFLVYRYMPFGDLASMLQTKGMYSKMRKCNPKIALDWITRLKIATGVAEGLVYLHHECSPSIVHRDVKASSILLDEMFEVRIGSLSTVRTGNKGPHPRLISCLLGISQSLNQADGESGAMGCSKDVYDFGKLLLGIISGKCGITDKHDSQTDSWVESAISLINMNKKNTIYQLLDPCMVVEGDLLEEVFAVALIAKACLNYKASKRPSMQYVLKVLENPRILFEDKSKFTQLSSPQYWNLFGSSRFANGSPSSSRMGSARAHLTGIGKTESPTFLVQNVSYINEIIEVNEDAA